MASVTFNPTTSGRAFRDGAGVNESFATIRGGAGTGSDTNNDITPGIRIVATSTSNQYRTNLTTFMSWNFGANLPSTATITAITQSVWTNTNATGLGNLSIVIASGTPASHTALATADYSQFGTTKYSTGILQNSMTSSGFTVWTWNATGIAAAQAALATYLDTTIQTTNNTDNSAPTWSSGAVSNTDMYFNPAGSNPPSITVTYTLPAKGGFLTFF